MYSDVVCERVCVVHVNVYECETNLNAMPRPVKSPPFSFSATAAILCLSSAPSVDNCEERRPGHSN